MIHFAAHGGPVASSQLYTYPALLCLALTIRFVATS